MSWNWEFQKTWKKLISGCVNATNGKLWKFHGKSTRIQYPGTIQFSNAAAIQCQQLHQSELLQSARWMEFISGNWSVRTATYLIPSSLCWIPSSCEEIQLNSTHRRELHILRFVGFRGVLTWGFPVKHHRFPTSVFSFVPRTSIRYLWSIPVTSIRPLISNRCSGWRALTSKRCSDYDVW